MVLLELTQLPTPHSKTQRITVTWIGPNTVGKNRQHTNSPSSANVGCRRNPEYFSAASGLRNNNGKLLPSKGGIGKRLKQNKSRLSEKPMLSSTAVRCS